MKKKPTDAELPDTFEQITDMSDVQFLSGIRELKRRLADLAQREKDFEKSVGDGSAAAPIREAHATRAKALRSIGKLLPAAIKQAKKGHPALLRLILRATK
jgi:hypothetical protein